ncbi:MAG: type II toxin-antitoxin system YafQ family toxin [Rickettsiales bacterium]|jgi:mRNA interferase YafQ
MRIVDTSNKFDKDLSRLKRRGKYLDKLEGIVEKLRVDDILPAKCRPHILSGDWDGFWELHVEPDWILIYEIDDDTIYLARTGTHSDLF